MRVVCALIVSTCFVWGCEADVKTQRINNYFEISGFFTSEAAKLKTLNISPIKWVKDNEGIRKSNEKKIDWDKELVFFIENDINKPAWKNSYSITSLVVDSIETLIYTAIEPKLSIREICIRKQLINNLITEIQIRKRTSNNLYTSFQTLNYAPTKGYWIVGNQDLRLLGKSYYVVNVNWESQLN